MSAVDVRGRYSVPCPRIFFVKCVGEIEKGAREHVSAPRFLEVLEIDKRRKNIILKIDEESGELFFGRRGFVKGDIRNVFDEGERSLFITFAHSEDSGAGKRIGNIGLFHGELSTEEVGPASVIAKTDESAIGNRDS